MILKHDSFGEKFLENVEDLYSALAFSPRLFLTINTKPANAITEMLSDYVPKFIFRFFPFIGFYLISKYALCSTG